MEHFSITFVKQNPVRRFTIHTVFMAVAVCATLFTYGQGAESPGTAFSDTSYWFVMEQDINATDDGWEFKTVIAPSAKILGFNEVTVVENIPAASDLNNPADQVYLQKYYDAGLYFLTSQLGLPTPTGYISTTGSFGFEEWWVIKVPSTKNVKIVLDISSTPEGSNYGKTISWYEINDTDDINDILVYTDPNEPTPYDNIPHFKGFYEYLLGLNGVSDSGIPRMTFTIESSDLSKDYILLRFGNNNFGYGYVTEYNLEVSTTNNTCEQALNVPVTVTEPFVSNTAAADKPLLDDSDKVDSPYNGKKESNFAGDDDYDLGNTSNGLWFRITDLDQPIYLATCGSGFNPQLVVSNGCPDDPSTPNKHFVAAENQNTNLGTDHNPAAISPVYSSGRGVCLVSADDPDWPVIVINPEAIADPTELYVYLNGGSDTEEGAFNFYAMDGPNSLLPVEWLAFEGLPYAGRNVLKWSTATETQNDFFRLEKSSDGENFETLAQVPGAGTTGFENHYQFADNQPYPTTHYRISQVDFDGAVNPGPEITVDNPFTTGSLVLQSNPIHGGTLRLTAQNLSPTSLNLTLQSIDGKRLETYSFSVSSGTALLELPVAHLTPGVYVLSTLIDGKPWTRRVVLTGTSR